MSISIPIYIRILFFLVFLVLLYIISSWVYIEFLFDKNTKIHYQEGFGGKEKYKYIPSKTSPNLSFEFTIDDLATDLSNACVFIKLDNQLKNDVKAKPTEPIGNSTSTTITPAPYSTDSEKTPPTTSQSSNTEPPETTTKPVNMESFTDSLNGDYTLPYTQLPIYNAFISETGYNNSTNDLMYKKMDDIYGILFDSTQINNLSDSNIENLWNKNKSITIDNAIYNGIYSFVLSKNRSCAYSNNQINSLSSYFLNQITQNKTRPTVLLSLKNTYYAIVKPRFVMNGLSNIYWKNAVSFTNSDKGTVNSILFVLNTFSEMVSINKLEEDLSTIDGIDITKDTTFTKDTLRLYQLISIGFELYRFVSYFEKNGLKSTSTIPTTFDAFISGYPQYLKKVNQIGIESPLVFLMRNPPNNEECPVINKLQPFLSTIES